MTGYTANTSTRGGDQPTPPPCRKNPDLHYPEGTGAWRAKQAAAAKAVCATCPVRHPCLQYALNNGERFGIWGGLDEEERATLLAGEELPPPKPPVIDRIRDLASRALSDQEIADHLGEGIGWKRIQTLRLQARIPCGRQPKPLRVKGAA